MAILSREEYFNRLQDYIGEDSSDKAINLVEDMTDTYNSFADRKDNGDEWKKKYEENDRSWRERYRRRFFTGVSAVPGMDEQEDEGEKVTAENITVDDLFIEDKED